MLTCSFILEECDPDHIITECVFLYFVIVFFTCKLIKLSASRIRCTVVIGEEKEITDTQEEKNDSKKNKNKV